MKRFKVGDHIIYHKQKASTCPGPRATDIAPAEHGDVYWYFVDKYWTVAKVHEDGTLDAITRRGKLHTRLKPSDPKLRKSNLIDELLHGGRFPDLEEARAERSNA